MLVAVMLHHILYVLHKDQKSNKFKIQLSLFSLFITVQQQNTQPLFELSASDEWELNTPQQVIVLFKTLLFY